MKTTDKFNEILMVANGGYEDIANKLFADTLGQFSRGFSEKESAMMGGVPKDRIFLRFFDPGRYYGAPNLQLMAVGLEGAWFLLPDQPGIYMDDDLSLFKEDLVFLGGTEDGEIYEVIEDAA